MLSRRRCLATAKISAGKTSAATAAVAALSGVLPHTASPGPGRSGMQRHRIDDALQVGEPEGLVEEAVSGVPAPLDRIEIRGRSG